MPTDALRKKLGERLLHNEPLARYTAARLGGPADWLFVARDSVDELAAVVADAWANNIPVWVIGSGANVLIADKGVRGLVVINRVSEIEFGDWHAGRIASATAGAGLMALAQKCQSHGWSGLEWAVGIPGTVGGAIVNNAGAFGGEMANCVADVVILEQSGPKLYANRDLGYGYRHSVLKTRVNRRFVILLATFTLSPDDPEVIQTRMLEFTERRKRTQPPGASLGSVFKNPPGDYAGRLIEAVGLKGYRIGRVVVSPVHANFLIHDTSGGGAATAADYYALIRHIREAVYQQSGVELELEIELLGEWDQLF